MRMQPLRTLSQKNAPASIWRPTLAPWIRSELGMVFWVFGRPRPDRPRTTFRPSGQHHRPLFYVRSTLTVHTADPDWYRNDLKLPIYMYTIFACTCVRYSEIRNTLKTVRSRRPSPSPKNEEGRRGVLPPWRFCTDGTRHLQGAVAVGPRLVCLFTLRGNSPR